MSFVCIVKDPTVTVKCRTAIEALFLYLTLCLMPVPSLFAVFSLWFEVEHEPKKIFGAGKIVTHHCSS
jgi:hypothetical protein